MVGSWRTFIYLKGVERLRSKTSNVSKSMEAEFFPEVRSNGGWSLLWMCQGKMVVILDLTYCQV